MFTQKALQGFPAWFNSRPGLHPSLKLRRTRPSRSGGRAEVQRRRAYSRPPLILALPFPAPYIWSKHRLARGHSRRGAKDAHERALFLCASQPDSDAQTHRHQIDPDHRRRPDRHRPGLRVRLFRHAGLQGAEGRGLPGHPGQFQSGDDHDRSRISPTPPTSSRSRRRSSPRSSRRSAPDALLPDHGRADRAQLRAVLRKMGVLEKFNVKMIGATADAIDKAEDRELFREAMTKIGLETPRSHQVKTLAQALHGARRHRPAGDHPPVVHARRHRRRHRLQQGRVHRDRRARHRRLAHQRSADRGIGARLERIRDGGGARQEGQLHHHLLDRERRSDGRAHRRFDHRRAGADAHRQGIPDHARRLDRGAARDRRRDRRLQRAVRGQSGRRPAGRHRDEPARVALLGAGVEGDRLSRSPRSRPSSRSATRSTRSPTTSPAARRRPRSSRPSITSSPKSRASPSRNSPAPNDAHHLDEIGRRSHGDRPHLPGKSCRRRCARWRPASPASTRSPSRASTPQGHDDEQGGDPRRARHADAGPAAEGGAGDAARRQRRA